MVPIAIENFKILYFIIHIIKMFQSTSKLLKTIQLVSLTYSVFFKFYHFCFPFQRICVYGWVMGTMSHQLTESGLLFQLILHLLPRERKIFIHIDKSFKQTDAQHYNDEITCILFSNSEVQGVPNICPLLPSLQYPLATIKQTFTFYISCYLFLTFFALLLNDYSAQLDF